MVGLFLNLQKLSQSKLLNQLNDDGGTILELMISSCDSLLI